MLHLASSDAPFNENLPLVPPSAPQKMTDYTSKIRPESTEAPLPRKRRFISQQQEASLLLPVPSHQETASSSVKRMRRGLFIQHIPNRANRESAEDGHEDYDYAQPIDTASVALDFVGSQFKYLGQGGSGEAFVSVDGTTILKKIHKEHEALHEWSVI